MSAHLVPYPLFMTLLQEERSDNERQDRDGYGINEAGVDVSRTSDESCRDEWKKSAEPAVAKMIWKRHRRISNPCRERLDKECSDRPVNHRHEYNLHENQQRQYNRVH